MESTVRCQMQMWGCQSFSVWLYPIAPQLNSKFNVWFFLIESYEMKVPFIHTPYPQKNHSIKSKNKTETIRNAIHTLTQSFCFHKVHATTKPQQFRTSPRFICTRTNTGARGFNNFAPPAVRGRNVDVCLWLANRMPLQCIVNLLPLYYFWF